MVVHGEHMSVVVELEAGTCLAFGGTNARMADCASGDIIGFSSVETPTRPKEFFQWMARNLLEASHRGSTWLVAGFPGPVSPDGQTVGPLVNVSGMREEEYDLGQELSSADPEVGRVLEQGFIVLPVNDGALAAQAAASQVGEHRYNKTGALIFGTGVGAGVVEKDDRFNNVHRVDKNPLEIGHLLVNGDADFETFEEKYSGPGIEARFGIPATDMPGDHPAWIEQGAAAANLSMTLGIMSGVELVVPTGGLGIGASDKYGKHLRDFIRDYENAANNTQKKFIPEIVLLPPNQASEFEIYGAEGAMRDHMTT